MMRDEQQDAASVVTTLFEHNVWANLKLLDFCEQLSDEQLDTTAIGCFGSIRDTLLHIVGAEVGYVQRVNGRLPGKPPAADGFPGFASLRQDARWASDELKELARTARAGTTVRQQPPRQRVAYPLASLIVQAVSHSTEHRTQVSAIITQLGLEPPDLSGWSYMRAMGELQDWGEEA